MDLRSLAPAVILFVIVTIVLTVGSDVVDEIQDDQTADSYAYNASESGLEGLDTLADWLPTIALALAAVVVIGVIVRYFRT